MNYSIKWSQDYPGWQAQQLIKQLEDLRDELTEQVLNHEEFDFPEATQVLARIMAK